MDIVAEVREILIAAKPANLNTPSKFIDLRAASPERIEQLIAELDRHVPRDRTYERPGRAVVHPAPWVRRMVGA